MIEEGSRVLLYLDDRRTWLVKAKTGSDAKFHTHAGIVDLGEMIGKDFGDNVVSSLGIRLFLLRPLTLDFIMKSERRTQIVYPKDFAYISARSGLRNGSRVLECGTGSGALTSYFASVVSPDGYVHTFEERSDFFDIAKSNVEKAGISERVAFENKKLSDFNIHEAELASYDLAMIDIGDPWSLLEIAHSALKGSGYVFCICPTVNQLERVIAEMENRFVDLESVEILLRRIEARPGKTRPSMRMIGHTCYLASGRKVNMTKQEGAP